MYFHLICCSNTQSYYFRIFVSGLDLVLSLYLDHSYTGNFRLLNYVINFSMVLSVCSMWSFCEPFCKQASSWRKAQNAMLNIHSLNAMLNNQGTLYIQVTFKYFHCIIELIKINAYKSNAYKKCKDFLSICTSVQVI